ncbi:MAG: hypothetical protein ABIU86_00785 [Gemmatimonadaceae bacterium]
MSRSDLAVLEARLFGRYLLDSDPSPELIGRYAAANAALFPGEPGGADAALIDFVSRHPRALPFLDAAAGLLRPDSLLRKKILLMAAIQETSVHHADAFLAAPPGRTRTILLLARYAASAGVKFAIGAAILSALPRRRSEGA